jgi:hypothetical protein
VDGGTLDESAPIQAETMTFHLNFAERFVFSTVFLLVFVGLGIAAATAGPVGDRAVGVGLLLVGVTGLYLAVFRIRVVVTTDQLHIYNPFRTRVVSLGDIDRVEQEYEGMKLRLKNGKAITVTAIQKWNVSVWLGRTTRADQVANLVNQRVRQAR